MAIPTRLAPIGRKWRKPYDSEVEYLEGTGTQFIKIRDYIGENVAGIDITVSHVAAANVAGIVGAWNGSSRANSVGYSVTKDNGAERGWFVNTNDGITNSTAISYDATPNNRTRIVVNGTSVTVNGEGYAIGHAWSYGTNVYGFALFGCWHSSNQVATCRAGRIYACTLYGSNGNALCELSPVTKHCLGYMYDRLSGRLFGNDGTGEFVVGPIRTAQEES